MRNKKYWGIAILIILLVGVIAILLLRDTDTDPVFIYKTDVEPARTPQTELSEKPTAREGYKMVRHGDHWHEVPISDTGQNTDTSHQNANTRSVSLDTSDDRNPMYKEVAASDEVPKYAELKRMTMKELGALLRESHKNATLLSDEHSKRFDAWSDAQSELTRDAKTNAEYDQILMANQDKLKPLEETMKAVLRELYVHQITGSRTIRVYDWLAGIESQKTKHFSISWTLPEPFDE